MKKHIFLIFLLILCLMAFAGCAKSEEGKNGEGETTEAVTTETPGNKETATQRDESEEISQEGNDDPDEIILDDDEIIVDDEDIVIDEGDEEDSNGAPENPNGKDDGASGEKEITTSEDPLPPPDENVDPETLEPAEDFTGTFENDDYTAYIQRTDDDKMTVKIVSSETGGKSYEWTMSGYFSHETSRIRYNDAVKKSGSSTNDSYSDGSGTIQFTDADNFVWYNNFEPIEKNEFHRAQ